jgi:hypothetical protein
LECGAVTALLLVAEQNNMHGRIYTFPRPRVNAHGAKTAMPNFDFFEFFTAAEGLRQEQFTNEMSELFCKDLRGKSLPRNRSKAGFACRQATVSSVKC